MNQLKVKLFIKKKWLHNLWIVPTKGHWQSKPLSFALLRLEHIALGKTKNKIPCGESSQIDGL